MLSLKQRELRFEPLIFPDSKFSTRFQAKKGAQVQEWMFWMLGESGRGPGLAHCADTHLHLQIKPIASS